MKGVLFREVSFALVSPLLGLVPAVLVSCTAIFFSNLQEYSVLVAGPSASFFPAARTLKRTSQKYLVSFTSSTAECILLCRFEVLLRGLYPDPVDYITCIAAMDLIWSRYRTAPGHTLAIFLEIVVVVVCVCMCVNVIPPM